MPDGKLSFIMECERSPGRKSWQRVRLQYPPSWEKGNSLLSTASLPAGGAPVWFLSTKPDYSVTPPIILTYELRQRLRRSQPLNTETDMNDADDSTRESSTDSERSWTTEEDRSRQRVRVELARPANLAFRLTPLGHKHVNAGQRIINAEPPSHPLEGVHKPDSGKARRLVGILRGGDRRT